MYKAKDNAMGNLDAAINSVVTSITLQSGDGANFWIASDTTTKPTANEPLYLTIVQYVINDDTDLETSRLTGVSKQEIVRCTNISTDVLTIERGSVATTGYAPQSFDAGAFVFANDPAILHNIGMRWDAFFLNNLPSLGRI